MCVWKKSWELLKCLIKILLDYFESIFVSIILQKMCRSILIIVVFDEYPSIGGMSKGRTQNLIETLVWGVCHVLSGCRMIAFMWCMSDIWMLT